MGNQQRQDEQRHAGANAAALLGDFNIDPRKMKDQTFAQCRNSEKVEKGSRYPSGARLKETNHLVEKEIGQRDHQEDEKKREVTRLCSCPSK